VANNVTRPYHALVLSRQRPMSLLHSGDAPSHRGGGLLRTLILAAQVEFESKLWTRSIIYLFQEHTSRRFQHGVHREGGLSYLCFKSKDLGGLNTGFIESSCTALPGTVE